MPGVDATGGRCGAEDRFTVHQRRLIPHDVTQRAGWRQNCRQNATQFFCDLDYQQFNRNTFNIRGDAIETYKYLHGRYKVDSSALLPLADESEG